MSINRDGCIIDAHDITLSHVRELTVVKEENPYYDEPETTFEVFKVCEDEQSVIVPRHWATHTFGVCFELEKFGYVYRATRLVFEGCLRSDIQRRAVDMSVEQLRYNGGVGVLSLPTGTGKTVVALYVACMLKVKTLVVVHKQFLMGQWVQRIQQFVPTARIGRLQQGNINVQNCDIIVGMLQSIAMRDYDQDIFADIGLVVFDEVHVVPTPVFSRALLKLSVPYMLGLSATPERRDGLSRIIHWFLGPTFLEHQLEGKSEVSVHVTHYNCKLKVPRNRQGFVNMTVVTTILSKMKERNALIVEKICNLVKDEYRVMVLSDRRLHCEELMCQLQFKAKIVDFSLSSALYIGGMKEHELEESKTRKVLLATFAMAKEGLDIPVFDALVLASPRSDVVQACGRILHSNTCKAPVIVDIVDDWFMGFSQFNKRQLYYEQAGFTIIF